MEGQSQGQCPETSHSTGQKLLKNILIMMEGQCQGQCPEISQPGGQKLQKIYNDVMQGQSQGQCPETSNPAGQKLLKNIQLNHGGSESRSMFRDFTYSRKEGSKQI